MRAPLIIISLLFFLKTEAQLDQANRLQQIYDSCNSNMQFECALRVAKQMNQYLYNTDSDTSLRYAISLRVIGNSFSSLKIYDSAYFSFDSSLVVLKKQNRGNSIDAAKCYYNISGIFSSNGEFNLADSFLQVALKIFTSSVEKDNLLLTMVLNRLGFICLEKDDCAMAEKYFQRSLEIQKSISISQSLDLAQSFDNFGFLHYKNGEYGKSILEFRKALEIYLKLQDGKNSYVLKSMGGLSDLYLLTKDYNSALDINIKILDLEKNTKGDGHVDLIKNYKLLGDISFLLKDYNSALSYQIQAYLSLKKVHHNQSIEVANVANTIGLLNYLINNYDTAKKYYEEVLLIRKRLYGDIHPDVAEIQSDLGDVNCELGNYIAAEKYYNNALFVTRKISGGSSPEVAEVFINLANLFLKQKIYKSAEEFFKQAIKIQKFNLGENSLEYAESLHNLGYLYIEKGDYKFAKPFIEEALAIQLKAYGFFNKEVATCISNLGRIYFFDGNFKIADSLFTKALSIQKKIFTSDNQDIANTYNNLALLYQETGGDFRVAEQYYKLSSDIYKRVLGAEHPLFASSLNNLGLFHYALGNYMVAESFFKNALAVQKKFYGGVHQDVAMTLNNLGLLYLTVGDYVSSDSYFNRSFDIYKNLNGDTSQSVALVLNNLGLLYFSKGTYKQAELFYKKSIEIRKRVLGIDHPDYAQNLTGLGLLFYKKRDFNSSELFIMQALAVLDKYFGKDYSEYIINENLLAAIYLETNREMEAKTILKKNFTKIATRITENFEWLGENQKELFWKKESYFFDALSWFATKSYQKVPEAAALNYNATLLSKSKLLESKISTENYFRDINELREELLLRRRLVAKIESEGSVDQNRLNKLRLEADSLDKRLTLSWPEYSQQKKNLSITWEQVQQNLEEGEAAIEFVRYMNDDSSFYYNALVLKKGDLYPVLVKLCKEVDLKAITPMFGSSEYYHLIWKPLDSVLLGVKTIFYAPVGELNNVPFHSIRLNDQVNEYVMDRYTLHQLTSTRYLAMGLKQKEKSNLKKTISMVGGVNYNYLPGMHSESDLVKRDRFRSENSIGRLEYLPGTKTEVEQIGSIVTSTGWETKLLSNNDAKEENIIKMEGRDAPGVLHLATHGYAFPEFDFKDTTINKRSLRYSYRYSTNSMVRSGLILSGGNWAWTGSDTLTKMGAEQNGILTALEVSQLNLKNTKLVVLSACETGLGKIDGSEGTFGLKRAFKLAGVEQIIVSLWPVPDKETMELMTLFYSDLTTSFNPIVSFAKAQKAMRDKYPTSPQTWAGFVLVR